VRTAAGVAAVTEDPDLTDEARDLSAASAQAEAFLPIDENVIATHHPNQWGRVFTATTAGSTPDDAFDNAVESDVTQASLLEARADVAGLGVALAADGSYYLVVLLGQSV
jgi:hypothetical protein